MKNLKGGWPDKKQKKGMEDSFLNSVIQLCQRAPLEFDRSNCSQASSLLLV